MPDFLYNLILQLSSVILFILQLFPMSFCPSVHSYIYSFFLSFFLIFLYFSYSISIHFKSQAWILKVSRILPQTTGFKRWKRLSISACPFFVASLSVFLPDSALLHSKNWDFECTWVWMVWIQVLYTCARSGHRWTDGRVPKHYLNPWHRRLKVT